jgi:predicted house-cleaning noncanonical NTP pyrophosphatase (MazG superfamily)
MTTIMSYAAEILEKTAEYIERIEGEKIATRTAEKKKTASALVGKLTEAIGEPMDESLAEKLSNLDPEMQQIIAKLAGTERVDSMGEPGENNTQKVASANGLPSEDERLLAWCNS